MLKLDFAKCGGLIPAIAQDWKTNEVLMLAKGKCGLMLNARKAGLEAILKLLPALEKPTVSPLSDPEWVAVNTIISEVAARELIPELKRAGAQGIVEFPLNKIIE